MRLSSAAKMTLAAALSVTAAACGGGGGGPAATPVAVTAKTPVLTNYSTTVFANFSGTTVSDGSTVTFSIASFTSYSSNGGGAATLTSPTPVASGANGKQRASVKVKSNVRSDVTVAASAGTYAGSKLVKFIPQPDKAVVHVALTRNVSNLAALSVIVKNDLGAVFTTPTAPVVEPFRSYTSSVSTSNSFTFSPGLDVFNWLLLKLGINAVANAPLMDITFLRDPAAATPGIPSFTVQSNPASPQQLSFNYYTSTTVTPPAGASSESLLTPGDYLLTVDYYQGSSFLATNQ